MLYINPNPLQGNEYSYEDMPVFSRPDTYFIPVLHDTATDR